MTDVIDLGKARKAREEAKEPTIMCQRSDDVSRVVFMAKTDGKISFVGFRGPTEAGAQAHGFTPAQARAIAAQLCFAASMVEGGEHG